MTLGPRLRAALVGLLAAAVALGIGETVAALTRPAAAPVIAVGNRFIELTPESVKRWAIGNFGTSDKSVLLSGIYVTLALGAVLVGLLALRRLTLGLAGFALFTALGCYAALTAHGHRGTDVVPTLLGGAAGVAVLVRLARAAAVTAAPAGPPPGTLAEDRAAADRRRFLQGGAAAAGLAVVAGFGGRALQHARFDVARARSKVTLPPPVDAAQAVAVGTDLGKSPVPWATKNSEFYRIDTALAIPQLDPNHWSLRIHGLVDREVRLSYAELTARPMIERWITLCCVSNEVGGGLVGNARFLGVRLADVLREAGVHADADQLMMRSGDGMTIGAPTAVVMDGRDALIAVGMNGVPLPVKHGFPARIVVPGLYGYVSACKWVVEIEATTFADQQAYWVQGGWAPHPDIKLQSRIDTPRSGGAVAVGRPVAIAGVAWDQHVGVSAVQVRVGDGPWQDARLAAVPSTDTWRQWVLPWTPPAAGSYRVSVRATDAAGNVQPDAVREVYPDGATGLHTITVRAR